jgi:hypothetical protein
MSRGSLSGDDSYSGSQQRRVLTPLNRLISQFLLVTIGVDGFVFDAINHLREA